MNDLEIMNRMEEIEEQLKPLHKLEKEKEQLKDSCKHNIIVVTEIDSCYSLEAICLFCGRRFKSNRELYGYEGLVDLSDYYCIFWDSEKMVEVVKAIYKEIVLQNENLKTKELSDIVEKTFKDRYKETKEILESIAKKVQQK